MPPARQADAELDTLIEEITVDAYDQDEQLIGFENAFDEDASFPCSGTVVGEEVQVLSVSRSDNRHALIAICQRPLRFTQTRAARYGGRELSGTLWVAVITAASP